MPPCYCNLHQCHGGEVDRRTLKIHLSEDRAAAAHVARNSVANVIDTYVEDIGIHLSGLTLADEVSGGPTSGGRLWSRSKAAPGDLENIATIPADRDTEEVDNNLPPKSRSSPPKPKSRSATRLDRKFEELEAFDMQIRAFAREASGKVASLQPSSPAAEGPETFPLAHLRRKCRAFKRDLSLIKTSDRSVMSFKQCIEEDLKETNNSLDDAEKEWASRPRPAKGGGVYYDTSE
jgi:hypothetical protein